MKLSQKEKRHLSAEIVRIVESNDFLTQYQIANFNDIDQSVKGFMLEKTVSCPTSNKFFIFDDMIYWVHPKSTNKSYASVVPYAKLKSKNLKDSLEYVTPYEDIESFNVYSDIGCVTINGLAISTGYGDGRLTVHIRKDLSTYGYPKPKASCYVDRPQYIKPIDSTVKISTYDCDLEITKEIKDVVSIWICEKNIYVYVR